MAFQGQYLDVADSGKDRSYLELRPLKGKNNRLHFITRFSQEQADTAPLLSYRPTAGGRCSYGRSQASFPNEAMADSRHTVSTN